MERAKNSHWVSVFAGNSHRGWITPPLFKQSDNLLDSSDGRKVLLQETITERRDKERGVYRGIVVLALSVPSSPLFESKPPGTQSGRRNRKVCVFTVWQQRGTKGEIFRGGETADRKRIILMWIRLFIRGEERNEKRCDLKVLMSHKRCQKKKKGFEFGNLERNALKI